MRNVISDVIRPRCTRWPFVLALVGLLAACNSPGPQAARLAEAEIMTEFHGTISMQTPGDLDAEVFLLHPDGKVVAVNRVLPSGRYAIAPPSGYVGGLLLAKLYHPVVGARAVSVGATPERPIDITTAAGEVVALEGRVVMPDQVPLEWLDIHLTPRMLDGLPQVAAGALLAVGPEPVRRGTYVTTRITQPSFALAVLPGIYRLEVERLFFDSAGMASPPVSVKAGSVTVTSGPPAEAALTGAWLTVRRAVSVTVQMVVVPPEKL